MIDKQVTRTQHTSGQNAQNTNKIEKIIIIIANLKMRREETSK